MIVTVTLNPALDYIAAVDPFLLGRVNRTKKELFFGGGKGINVSKVLTNLGLENIALGLIAGFTGEEIQNQAEKAGCKTDFVRLSKGISRINMKIRGKEETEINGMGPEVSAEEMEQLYGKLDQLEDGDFLALCGSIPASLKEDAYEKILERLKGKKINIAVDASKSLILNTLRFKPFLIKPNHFELGEMFGVEIKGHEEIVYYGKKLQQMGARNVLVSMASKGAVLLAEDGSIFTVAAPKGTVKNSVGAGDSMVAGFLAGYLEKGDTRQAVKMAVAAGSASAFSYDLATKEEIFYLLDKITV